MNRPHPPELVPASLVRLRCFINRRGMKVKPWLGPREVLAAFYRVLERQRDDDTFWTELRELLADLAQDLSRRLERHGRVVQNELLDSSQHEELLAQIRAALAAREHDAATLAGLAAKLPAAAAALVLMIGAATAVGCGGTTDSDGTVMVAGDAGPDRDASVNAGGAGADASTTDAAPDTSTMDAAADVVIPIDAVSPVDVVTPVDAAADRPDTGFDATAPDTCEPELVDALVDCSPNESVAQNVVDCTCVLNDSWRTGLADLLADASCGSVRWYLGRDCGLDWFCVVTERDDFPESFDVEYLLDNACIMVYMGVRCE